MWSCVDRWKPTSDAATQTELSFVHSFTLVRSVPGQSDPGKEKAPDATPKVPAADSTFGGAHGAIQAGALCGEVVQSDTPRPFFRSDFLDSPQTNPERQRRRSELSGMASSSKPAATLG